MKPLHPASISCTGKEGMTNTQARRIAGSMRKKGRGAVQHYHCQHCGEWHVGNRVGKIPDQRREVLGKNRHDEEAT